MRTKLLALLMTMVSATAYAQLAGVGQPQVQKYARCYGQFVRQPMSFSDPRVAQIVAGTLTGTEACMQLVSEADFEDDNQIKRNDGDFDVTGLAVLKTFNDLHRSWFSKLDFRGSLYYSPANDLNDNNEMGYYYTRALFDADHDYTSILKGNRTIQGIRHSNMERPERYLVQQYQAEVIGGVRYPFRPSIGRDTCVVNPSQACSFDWEWSDVPLNQLGLLVGIKERDPYVTDRIFSRTGESLDIYQTMGGGLIGSMPFFALNRNLGFGGFGDGGMHVDRRWSKAVFEDVLCRQIPVVRIRDATAYVTQDVDLPFIKGEACMGCHTSLDPMARTTRNYSIFPVGHTRRVADNAGQTRLSFLYEQKPTVTSPEEESNFWHWPKDIPNYRVKPPRGILYYRNMNGDLIENNVTGVQELADEILKQPDIYACAAKRYLYFLTGIDTVLYDQGKLIKPRFDELQTKHQAFVYELGSELRQHKDLKQIIRRIVDSPYYLEPDKKD